MAGLRDHRVRIVVGILLLVLGMFMTVVATYPTPMSPYYEENGSLSFEEGNVIQLPTNVTALYPYEYKNEYSLKVTLWGTGEVALTNTYTGEKLNISLSRDGVPITIIPPAIVELSSSNAHLIRYSLAIYPSSSVSSELWLLIPAMIVALVGAVLGVSGVMSFIIKRFGENLLGK